jgi:hypothetical protein
MRLELRVDLLDGADIFQDIEIEHGASFGPRVLDQTRGPRSRLAAAKKSGKLHPKGE